MSIATLATSVHSSEPVKDSSLVYDLSVKLMPAKNLFTIPINASSHLVYVPDAPGMPVILSDPTYKVLRYFDESKNVGEVIEQAHFALNLSLPQTLKLVERLYDGWFLRELDDDFSEAIQWRHNRRTPKEL